MQKMNTDTLAGNLAVPSLEYDGYASFFSGLLEVTHTRAVDDGLGERIEEYVMSWLGDHALDGFDDYSADGYRRTYLGRSPETGWEAIVMSWQEGNRTSIHAHPQFAGYFFADGRFLVEILSRPQRDTPACSVRSSWRRRSVFSRRCGRELREPYPSHHLLESDRT